MRHGWTRDPGRPKDWIGADYRKLTTSPPIVSAWNGDYYKFMLDPTARIFIDLLMNLTLLVALSILSGFIERRLPSTGKAGVVMQGVLFGLTAVFGMMRPLVLAPGLFFDGRSVMVSLCALFFGPVAAGISVLLVAAYRAAIGGAGTVTGILVIASSAGIGIAARSLSKPRAEPPSSSHLFVFGIVVHLAMLALMSTLPGGTGLGVVMRIGLPVLILYPLATILAGKILSDQAESHRMLAALSKSEERFKLSMDATSDGLWDLDVSSGTAYYNPAYFRILGYEPGEFPSSGLSWQERLYPDDRELVLAANNACIDGESDFIENEYRLRHKNGQWRWILARAKCIARSPTGRALRIVGTHVDITERKEAEERLRRNLAEKEILLKEIHHRVKNNLTVVSSLLNLQADTITSPEQAVAAFQNSRDRIFAISMAHEVLYQASDFTNVDMNDYLKLLIRQLSIAYDSGDRIRFSLDDGGVRLSVSSAIPCGLIINELVTNAIKYAFPDGRSGKINVALHAVEGGSLELRVADDGIGLPVDFDSEDSDSLGLTLVRLLVEQLHGELLISDSGGAVFRVSFIDAVST